jgi:hypothetical protein
VKVRIERNEQRYHTPRTDGASNTDSRLSMIKDSVTRMREGVKMTTAGCPSNAKLLAYIPERVKELSREILWTVEST